MKLPEILMADKQKYLKGLATRFLKQNTLEVSGTMSHHRCGIDMG